MVIEAAYATCQRLARQHYENFPVASRLLPKAVRPHIAAIYAFARIADDFADEGERSDEARLALLGDWRQRLRETVAGRATRDESDAAAIFTALGHTIRTFALEPELLDDLMTAFEQDVRVKRYETWDDLLDYCRRSANPVGRLVLRISRLRAPQLDAWSDAVCTALQLTNFWQDLGRDWKKGRLYVPATLVRKTGAAEVDLHRWRISPEWRAALTEAAAHTRRLYEEGRPIADAVKGRLRWELRATWLGGMRVLDRLELAGFDVFRSRPELTAFDASAIVWHVIAWRRASRPQKGV